MLMGEMETRILAMAKRLAEVEADRDALYDRLGILESQIFRPLSASKCTIVGVVAAEFDIAPYDIIGPFQHRDICAARHAYFLIARTEGGMNVMDIGRSVRRDHTTVIYGTRRAEHFIATDPEFANKINRIRARLREWAGDPLTNTSQPDEPLTGHPSNGVPQRHVIASGDGGRG
jgi:hypothetical protein